MVTSDELISYGMNQIVANSTTTRRSFYIAFITNLRSRVDFVIPSSVVLVILKSFDSIVYKIAIRMFVYCKDSFLKALSDLSKEDQERALSLIVHDGFTLPSDVTTTKENAQDAYSSELRNYLTFNCTNSKQFDFLFHSGVGIVSINNLALYYMRVLGYCSEYSVQWAQTLVNECLDLLVCTGRCISCSFLVDDRKSYSSAVVSSIFTTVLIACDVAHPEDTRYCCVDTLIRRAHDLNVPFLTKTLLYGLMFTTTPSTLPRVIQNLNYVINFLLSDPSRISLLLVICLLIFIYIYDYNYQLLPTRSNIRRGDSERLVNLVNMKPMENLLDCSFDLVSTVGSMKHRLYQPSSPSFPLYSF